MLDLWSADERQRNASFLTATIQDYPYLSLIIDEVQQSQRERSELDNTVIALRRRPDVRQEAKG